MEGARRRNIRAVDEMQHVVAVDVDGRYFYRLGRLYMKPANKTAATRALDQSAKLRRNADAAATFDKYGH
jgi:hypothetical protein